MFYVYIPDRLKNGELYIGYTGDLRERLEKHNQGLNHSTKRYVPWKIVYYEACLNKKDALRREKYLKTSQGRRLIKRRIKEYLFEDK